MIETIRPNDGIDEHRFGYNPNIEKYLNSSLDMKEFAEFAHFVEEAWNSWSIQDDSVTH